MEILYDIEEIDKRAIKYLLDAKEKFDNCIDSAGPSAMVSAQYLWDAVVEVKKKGVKIRLHHRNNQSIIYPHARL